MSEESNNSSDVECSDAEDIAIIESSGKRSTKDLETKRKGPGRPRKVPRKEPTPRYGIAKHPRRFGNIMELHYDNPLILKKIVSFFKSLAAAQIQIIFRQTHIIMFAKDHYNKTYIRVKINGQRLNHYYCQDELNIGINCRDLELILNKVDKDYSNIIFTTTKANIHKNISVVLENDIQIDEEHVIDLIGTYPRMENEEEFIREDYMIKFTFPGKYFRKTISDIKTISSQLSIEQEEADQPLKFGYFSENKKIRSSHIVKNDKKINLQSNLSLDPDEHSSFRIDIKIDYIKPISSSHIADKIDILADEDKRFMTKATLDNDTFEIKTLTDIIDRRPQATNKTGFFTDQDIKKEIPSGFYD